MRSQPYVREAYRSEYAELARLLCRAFEDDAQTNYFADLKTVVHFYLLTIAEQVYLSLSRPTQSTSTKFITCHSRNLEAFFHYQLRLTAAAGARITVVVVPMDDSALKTECKKTWRLKTSPFKKKEMFKLAAVCIWTPPQRQRRNVSLSYALMQTGYLRVLCGWGPKGFKVRFVSVLVIHHLHFRAWNHNPCSSASLRRPQMVARNGTMFSAV